MFIAFILSCFSLFSSPSEKKYKLDEAIVYYKIINIIGSDTIKRNHIYFFEDYGKRERLDKIINDTLKETYINDDGDYYVIYHKEKTWESLQYQPQSLMFMEIIDDRLFERGFTKGQKEFFLGKTCDVYKNSSNNKMPDWLRVKIKFVGWQNLLLKCYSKGKNNDTQQIATKLDLINVESSVFAIPNDYKMIKK